MATRHPARQAARRRSRRAHADQHKPLYRRTLRYEPLEDRRLLALVMVDTPLDTVDPDDGLTSLREAIRDTNLVSGPDEITFDFGHDGPETIVLTQGELRITDDLTIIGPGADLLTIDASGNDPTPGLNNGDGSGIVNIDNVFSAIDVSIAGLTLTGGDTAANGGAIVSQENLTILDSLITGNSGRLGGGIYSRGGNLVLERTTISNNSALFGGGVFTDFRRTLTVTACTITHNEAQRDGGGIFTRRAATVADSTISYNSAAGGEGGGIDAFAGIAITNSAISYNSAGYGGGGGIRVNGGNVTITGSTMIGNSTAGRGGGIFSDSALTTLTNTTISGNSAGESGGALDALFVTLSNSVVSGNVAKFQGGGVCARAPFMATNSVITGNSAERSGGGIYGSRVALNSSSVMGNKSGESGGGIWMQTSENSTIANSTISGNSSVVGGGIYSNVGTTLVDHSTIAFNTATIAGGAFIASGTLTLNHTILAKNAATTNADLHGLLGTSATARFSLIGDGGVLFSPAPIGSPDANGNLIGSSSGSGGPIDPLLAPLAANGGPTLTHALLPGSPAINTGDLNAKAGEGGVPLYDQRGEPFGREVNGRIDIGAFEYQAASDLNLLVDTLDDESDGDHGRGDLSLREAIELANLYPSDDTIRFDSALVAAGPATIMLAMGELRITDDVSIEGLGANLLTIDASGNDPTPALDNGDGIRVFNLDENDFGRQFNVAITGLRLIGGDVNGNGGGIRSVENLIINDLILSDNASTSQGGGLYAFGNSGRVMIADVSAINNRAFDGGGMALYANGTSQMFVIRAMVENNTAQSRAGGIYALAGGAVGAAVISVASTTASHNFAGRHSGGGYFEANFNGNISASDCNFSDNESLGSGGGLLVFVANFMGTATINRSTFVDNVSNGNGGGLVLSNHLHGTITLSDATVSGNSAANRGGGIAVSHNNDYRTTTITTFLEGLRVTDNTSQGEGGGISFVGSNGGGKLSLSRSTITANSAALDGGGIHLYNSHTSQGSAASADEILLADNLIANNFADRDGGGLFASTKVSVQGSRGSLTIDRNTIYLNSASNGGGIYLHADTAVAQVGKVSQIISDSTVSSNLATGLGGGLFIGQQNLGSVDVNRSTIANNRSYLAGGGIFVTNGTLSMSHVIVATNGSPTGLDLAVILGATLSPRFSLIGSNNHSGLAESPVGSTDANGNLIGGSTNGFINPRIGPPVKNGGALPTHALRPGSPAINAGDPAAMAGVGGVPQFDQRGAPYVRVHGGRIDIGAFESQPVLLTGDYNFNGVVDAADVIIWRNTRLSSIDLRADGNGDGVVNQADWQVWRSNFGRTAESVEQGSGSVEREAENTEPEATGAPPPRPAWQPPASPGVSVATSRPAFRPATQRFAPQDDLLAALASPRAVSYGRNDFVPARRWGDWGNAPEALRFAGAMPQAPARDVDSGLAYASIGVVDRVFETLGADVAGTLRVP